MVSVLSPAEVLLGASNDRRSRLSPPKPAGSDLDSVRIAKLQDTAERSRIPYLRELLMLALDILPITNDVKRNKKAWKGLARDTCELVSVVSIVFEEREILQAGEMSQELLESLRELVTLV